MSGTRRRTLLGLVGLVLLLAAVAVASNGSVPTGTGGTRRLSDQFLDVLISLYLLAMLAGVGVWAYILLVRKDAVADAMADRPRRSAWLSVAIIAIGLGLLAVFVRWLSVDESLRRRLAGRIRPAVPGLPGGNPGERNDYRPEFATGPVLVVVALLAVVLVAWALNTRARRRRLESMPDALLPTLADVLEETLDDLRAETDPRRAVIAAYSRMERALAAYGLPRNPAEAPDEYLERIFSDLDVSRRATSRLTALFAWAKFSAHDVAPEMKQEAIEALEAVREELQAAGILAEQQRLQALMEQRGRAEA
ncbi:MAG: DUF4129 domain-containing protein [Thermoleophilia bacterium]|nr:DUF4129 domain-containing protein [Thermoleophilia bacterium]